MEVRLVLVCILTNVSGHVYCPPGEFQPDREGDCQPCSRCPDNEIVKETCWRQRDTICGPFTEFYQVGDSQDGQQDGSTGGARQTNHGGSSRTDSSSNNDNSNRRDSVTMAMVGGVCVLGAVCAVVLGLLVRHCRRGRREADMDATQTGAGSEDSERNTEIARNDGYVLGQMDSLLGRHPTPRPEPEHIELT